MKQVQAPKGVKDVVPCESYKWQYLEGIIRDVCARYGFLETRTPVIEHTELFMRGVGDTTDVVQKEMYTFLDKGGRSISLKPEGTAGTVRMLLENRLFNEPLPIKMYYLNSPVFRYEKPQAGRWREHHQFGVEAFGSKEASVDAECISMALELIEKMGVHGLNVEINSIGCPQCRPDYNQKLKAYFERMSGELCATCTDRLNRNPLRILDCKEERCASVAKGAPLIKEALCDECAGHFDNLQSCLNALKIPYTINPRIVRGLDYYTKTVFEIVSTGIGSQSTVCGGGRYDGLVEELGGPQMPGVGFGLGMERLLLTAQSHGVQIPRPESCRVYVAAMSGDARLAGFKLAHELRAAGVKAECDHMVRSAKAQFKYAGKLGARFVAMLGEDELTRGVARLKNMDTGEERDVEIEDLAQAVKA